MTKEEIEKASTWFLKRILTEVPDTEEEEVLIRAELKRRKQTNV